jgi:hypothetical protein
LGDLGDLGDLDLGCGRSGCCCGGGRE